jgi:Domain of unknown function (DUF892)
MSLQVCGQFGCVGVVFGVTGVAGLSMLTYYAENKIIKSLPSMIDSATNAQLKQGLKSHLRETEGTLSGSSRYFR